MSWHTREYYNILYSFERTRMNGKMFYIHGHPYAQTNQIESNQTQQRELRWEYDNQDGDGNGYGKINSFRKVHLPDPLHFRPDPIKHLCLRFYHAHRHCCFCFCNMNRI